MKTVMSMLVVFIMLVLSTSCMAFSLGGGAPDCDEKGAIELLNALVDREIEPQMFQVSINGRYNVAGNNIDELFERAKNAPTQEKKDDLIRAIKRYQSNTNYQIVDIRPTGKDNSIKKVGCKANVYWVEDGQKLDFVYTVQRVNGKLYIEAYGLK